MRSRKLRFLRTPNQTPARRAGRLVAQICNLPYRRFAFAKAPEHVPGSGSVRALRIEHPRLRRLQLPATWFWPRRVAFWGLCLLVACSVAAQNIVDENGGSLVAPPVEVPASEAARLADRVPRFASPLSDPEALRVARKLDAHVAEFLAGWPWMPFHHTLGISGYEAYFDRPDEMFFALALALPVLTPATAERARAFLAAQLTNAPPYALDGFDRRTGRARESYDVPPALRLGGRGRAASAFGVYAFWAWCHFGPDPGAAQSHWPAVKARMAPLLEGDYKFDIHRKDYANDEAEKLNGDLAGLIGFARLARLNRDESARQQALARAAQLLALRVNLERVNPKILDKTNSSTKHLHVVKLARFCSLVPEVGDALTRLTDGCGAARLKAFREARPAWWLAFSDRLIGGENYTNPLHFRRALFAGAALVEQLPARQLLGFIELPHGKADFHFIEQCAFALWAAQGRGWTGSE